MFVKMRVKPCFIYLLVGPTIQIGLFYIIFLYLLIQCSVLEGLDVTALKSVTKFLNERVETGSSTVLPSTPLANPTLPGSGSASVSLSISKFKMASASLVQNGENEENVVTPTKIVVNDTTNETTLSNRGVEQEDTIVHDRHNYEMQENVGGHVDYTPATLDSPLVAKRPFQSRLSTDNMGK